MKIITLRTNAWHGDWERVFEFPDNVTVDILSPKDSRPLTNREIMEQAKGKGFELKNIEIWFDNFQKFWRFNADLVRL